MNRPDEPVLPAGVPPEYADAYRRGFLSAFRGAAEPSSPEPAPGDADGGHLAMLFSPGGGGQGSDHGGGAGRDPRRTYLAPAVLVLLALVLVLGAYGLGRMLAPDAEAGSSAATGAADDRDDGEGKDGERAAAESRQQTRKPYRGPVSTAQVAGGSASCQTEESIDAAGNPTSYQPARAFDEDLSTAWRCDGSGVGERFTLSLAEQTVVGEVGLVPGYAKTDPANGVDRYAENNRITRVRWTFADGTSYVQEVSASPDDRSMRLMRVPPTRTDTIVIEILASRPGERNTVAVSELRVGAVRG